MNLLCPTQTCQLQLLLAKRCFPFEWFQQLLLDQNAPKRIRKDSLHNYYWEFIIIQSCHLTSRILELLIRWLCCILCDILHDCLKNYVDDIVMKRKDSQSCRQSQRSFQKMQKYKLEINLMKFALVCYLVSIVQ